MFAPYGYLLLITYDCYVTISPWVKLTVGGNHVLQFTFTLALLVASVVKINEVLGLLEIRVWHRGRSNLRQGLSMSSQRHLTCLACLQVSCARLPTIQFSIVVAATVMQIYLPDENYLRASLIPIKRACYSERPGQVK
jgi:hypothetical protein